MLKHFRKSIGQLSALRMAGASAVALLLCPFACMPAQAHAYTVLHKFARTGGEIPNPLSAIDPATGTRYGTTQFGGRMKACGGDGCGTVYKLDSAGTFTVLHEFTGSKSDGAFPWSGPILDSKGNLYGVTGDFGEGGGQGKIYEIDTAGNFSVLYALKKFDGNYPVVGPVMDATGNLYGGTFQGGANGGGTVFKLDTAGNFTVLYSFAGQADGSELQALLLDASGNIYGTTYGGGNSNCSYGCGTAFKIDSNDNFSLLYSFTGNADGGHPAFESLVMDNEGNLYGGTYGLYGAYLDGTVFKLTPAGSLTTLYAFTGGTDGALPNGPVVLDTAGNLYGATEAGGDLSGCIAFNTGCGVLYEVDSKGTFKVVHTFNPGKDGNAPHGGGPQGILQDASGNLFGTTQFGGKLSCHGGYGCGAIFKFTPK
jgi:uncharacterized repeat protein (TIGR03803 family)